MLSAVKDALVLAGPGRRRKFVGVGVLAVIVSGLEVAAALMIFVLMRLVLEPGVVPEIPLFGRIDRYLPAASTAKIISSFAVVFGAFLIVRSLAFLFQQYALGRVAENTGVILADRLFEGYLSMPYEFHLRRHSSELIRNAYDNVIQVVGIVFIPMATIFAESVLVLALVGVLVVASPGATAAATALMLLTVALTFAFVQPRLRNLGHKRQEGASASIRHLQQGLEGVRDVKLLAREGAFAKSFRISREVMAHAEYLRGTLAYVPRISIEIAFMGFVLAAIVFAAIRGNLESVLATVGLFAYAGLRLQPSLQKVSYSLNNLRFAEAAVSDLKRDLAELDTSTHRRRALEAKAEPIQPFKEVAFHDVRFRYPDADSDALSGIELRIHSGESIGICGPTGGGKSTLLDLLCGLLTPMDGHITIDDRDISDITRSWQRSIGVVHQSPFLIDDTLARNIAFGFDREEINYDALQTAVRASRLDELVDTLPHGVETMVGERGVRLSGGQRQRVTLARAIYRRPTMLILDEGTSALDNLTEAAVVDSLSTLGDGVTMVMVAHRLTSIRHCDRIVFLDGGVIAGIGTYEALYESNSAFRAMAN